MNVAQARALVRLMEAAKPVRRWPDDPEQELHAHVEAVGGHSNDWQVTMFSLTNTLDRIPDTYYLAEDGAIYVLDEEYERCDLTDAIGCWYAGTRAHYRIFKPIKKQRANA